ncbi:PASTA domain-containing protein [Nocardioides lijunqiniae]|uniref:PASTA domain-containing protein n=1 Tax=Nocardioides lijunqiniae TaxID=2760832 RepID=UPI0018779ABF|nr:PASTA domain-containing protein [Nocardioides lijunqiniae]
MTRTTPPHGAHAGWYHDPVDPGLIRYFDGHAWTPHTSAKPYGWTVTRATPTAAAPGIAQRRRQYWWALVPGVLVAALVLFAAGVMAGGSGPSSDRESARSPESSSAESSAPTSSSDPTPTPTAEAEPEPVTESEAPPARSVVPQLVGLTRQEAKAQLVAAGLVVEMIRRVPSAKAPGTVLRQKAKVGSSMVPGSGVVLVVASPFPGVPGVVGLSESEAVDRLKAAGFKVSVSTARRESGKNKVVLEQTPGRTARAKPGSTIGLVVSSVVKPPPPPPPPPSNCTSGYRPCLTPSSDYDCAGGSGDGPEYAYGPIYIDGSDPYDLDRDGDGVACES